METLLNKKAFISSISSNLGSNGEKKQREREREREK
jgi:hypothetical protein